MNESKHTPKEIESLIKSMEQGVSQCRDDERMDECSFGYETGVLITGNDAVYLLGIIAEVDRLTKEKSELIEALKSIVKWDDNKDQDFIKPGSMWTDQIKTFLTRIK